MKLGPHISLANNDLLQTCIFLFSPVRSHHFAWPGIPLGKTVANELCKIKDNLDATEDGESREEAHGSPNKTKGSLQGEGEVVFNLVVRCASNANHQHLEVVR